MHEKIRAYLDMQNKRMNMREMTYRADVLINANLYESYLGPHVEELFEPIYPNRTIRKSENLQYVIEKATGDVIGIKYDLKENAFVVMTPLDVTSEEFAQIEKYHKRSFIRIQPRVINICAYVLYVIAIGFFMASIIYPTFNWGYIVGAISVVDGIILNLIAHIVDHLNHS